MAWGRLMALVLFAGLVLAAPFAVFVRALYNDAAEASKNNGNLDEEFTASLTAWTRQLLARLFPFGRGLVHDYWAANVWALYTAAVKVVRFAARRLLLILGGDDNLTVAVDSWLEWAQYSAVTPAVTAVCLLVAQIPGWRLAYRAAELRSNALLLQSFTYTALATFLFQYHAHEKAILTALIPCTVWAIVVVQDETTRAGDDKTRSNGHKENRHFQQDAEAVWSFLWEFTALAVLGLFPLLYQPQEFLLKLSGYIAYLCALQYLAPPPTTTTTKTPSKRRTAFWIVVMATMVQLEFAPLRRAVYGRLEFAPLAVTSLVCALGIVLLFAELMLISTLSLR